MAVDFREYYNTLIDGIGTDAAVDRIVRGPAWTAAVLTDGRTGLAMHTDGESIARERGTLAGLSAREAAGAVMSWNFGEASEGMAVINAYYNTPEKERELCAGGESTGSLGGLELEGKTIVFIGHLLHPGGLTEAAAKRAERYYIIERSPKPGDYPDSACEYLIEKSDIVVITGSAAVNKTLPRLLELSAGKQIIMTGPTVTLCPELREYGVSRLNGCVCRDIEPMLRAIESERTAVNKWVDYFTLDM